MDTLHEYLTSVTWTEGRRGRLESPGLPTLAFGPPPDFGGDGSVWSPEHFFTASTETCILLTFLAIASLSKLELAGWKSSGKGKVEKVEGEGYQFTRVEVHAEVTVKRAIDVEKAERALQKAEKNCLVTKSLKSPVTFTYTVHVHAEGG